MEWHEFEPVMECPDCNEDHDDCECGWEGNTFDLIERDECKECGMPESEHEEEEDE